MTPRRTSLHPQGGSSASVGSSLGRKRRSAPSLCGSASGEPPEPEAARPAQRRNSAASAATFFTAGEEGCVGSDEEEEDDGRDIEREGAVAERRKGGVRPRSGSWYFDPGEGEEGMEAEVDEGWGGGVYVGKARGVEVQRAVGGEEGTGLVRQLGVGVTVPLREQRHGGAGTGGAGRGCCLKYESVGGQEEGEWALDMDGQGCWYTGGGVR